MCKPISKLNIPDGLEESCDAVASLYLHDKENALKVLINEPNSSNLQKRQQIIEHLKEVTYRDPSAKKSLDFWLWGKSGVSEVWTDSTIATLRSDLKTSLTKTGKWSLQIIPTTLAQAGHHMAIGSSPNEINWWLLDPASGLYVFSNVEDMVDYTTKLLTNSSSITQQTRTVLLKIT